MVALTVGATLLAVLALAGAGAALFVAIGHYDVSVTAQHTAPVYRLLEVTMHRSVQRRARDVSVPPLDAAVQQQRGAVCYRDNCLQCHGGPGAAQQPIGLSMQPLPGPLVDVARRWTAAELYWITREGIKMSGMPAWRHRLADADLWAVVSFLRQMPLLDPRAFRAAIEAADTCAAGAIEPAGLSGPAMGDAVRGKIALQQHACTACHIIPGLAGAQVHVGPPLAGLARRELIAGAVPNTPEQLARWIRDPRSIDPLTAMPALGVSEAAARDMVAYLATLH